MRGPIRRRRRREGRKGGEEEKGSYRKRRVKKGQSQINKGENSESVEEEHSLKGQADGLLFGPVFPPLNKKIVQPFSPRLHNRFLDRSPPPPPLGQKMKRYR